MLALAGCADAGFSGDWVARDVLSEAAAGTARSALLTACAAHVVLTGFSAFLAKAKGVGVVGAAATLLVSISSRFFVHRLHLCVGTTQLLRNLCGRQSQSAWPETDTDVSQTGCVMPLVYYYRRSRTKLSRYFCSTPLGLRWPLSVVSRVYGNDCT